MLRCSATHIVLVQEGSLGMSDFAIGPVLGTGSFGRVSLASYSKTGVMCAIKALSKSHVVKNQQASYAWDEPLYVCLVKGSSKN